MSIPISGFIVPLSANPKRTLKIAVPNPINEVISGAKSANPHCLSGSASYAALHAQALEGTRSGMGSKTSSQQPPHAVSHFGAAALFLEPVPKTIAKSPEGKNQSKSRLGCSSSAADGDDCQFSNGSDKLCSALRKSFESIAQVALLFMRVIIYKRIMIAFVFQRRRDAAQRYRPCVPHFNTNHISV